MVMVIKRTSYPERHDTRASFRVSLFNYMNQELDFVECLGEDEIGSAVDALIKLSPLEGGDSIKITQY